MPLEESGETPLSQPLAEKRQDAASTLRPGSGDVCVVSVKCSPKPRFVVEEGKENFFIRTGNATNALKMSEMLEYCRHRWPEALATDAP